MITAQEIQTVKQRFGIIGNSPLLSHAIQVAMQAAPTEVVAARKVFPKSSTRSPSASTVSSLPSTVEQSPKEPLIRSFLATKRDHLPAHTKPEKDILK